MEKILFSPLAIEDKVLELADKLNKLYPDEPKALYPVLTPILQGGITFFQDVAKNLLFDAYVDCVGVASYKGQSRGEIDLYKDWKVDLTDKDVWLIDDICDSGSTMAYLQQLAYDKGAKRVYKASLLQRETNHWEWNFADLLSKKNGGLDIIQSYSFLD